MTRPSISFDWTINFGAVVTWLGLLGTWIGILVVGSMAFRDLQRNDQDYEARLTSHAAALVDHRDRLTAQQLATGALAIELKNLDRLTTEVRDELRTMNRRSAP